MECPGELVTKFRLQVYCNVYLKLKKSRGMPGRVSHEISFTSILQCLFEIKEISCNARAS